MFKARCSSVFYKTVLETGTYQGFQCCLETGHDLSVHCANEPSKGFFEWSSEMALKSIEEALLHHNPPISKGSVPLIGWRTWRLCTIYQEVPQDHAPPIGAKGTTIDTTYRLGSTAAGVIWQSPVMTTRGLARVSPAVYCEDWGSLGVYSYKTPNLLLSHGPRPQTVFGRLDLTGHIVEHEWGYRAQKAIVREIWLTRFREDVILNAVEAFEATYDCPVHVLDSGSLQHWADFYSQEEEKSA